MINWICAYCGKNTSDVDYDYLVGTNHLVCVMQSDNKKIKLNSNQQHGKEIKIKMKVVVSTELLKVERFLKK